MRILIASFVLFCSLNGFATNAEALNVAANNPTFLVTLPSNPTTGYQWTVTKYDQKILKLIKSQYISPHTKLIGAGGNMNFTFALKKGMSYPKSTNMSFTYGRSWDPKSGTLKKMTVNFVKK